MPPLPSRHERGFSLTELLIVMAVIVMLVGLVVPAVSNFGRSTGLTTGGNLVANLAAFARQNALTKSTLTALVMMGEEGTEDDYRTFTVVEYNVGRGWTQITPWQKLPTGIVVDRYGEKTEDFAPEMGTFVKFTPRFPFLNVAGQPKQENPPVLYHGKQIQRYAARIFTASGSLSNPESPAHLRIVEGFAQGDATTYTRPDENGRAANYYDIALLGATGLTKIDRP